MCSRRKYRSNPAWRTRMQAKTCRHRNLRTKETRCHFSLCMPHGEPQDVVHPAVCTPWIRESYSESNFHREWSLPSSEQNQLRTSNRTAQSCGHLPRQRADCFAPEKQCREERDLQNLSK